MNANADELSRAMVVWLGHGYTRWPKRDEGRRATEFGYDRARSLINPLKQIWADFYASIARDIAPDLLSMGDFAIADYRKRGTTRLTDEALEALALYVRQQVACVRAVVRTAEGPAWVLAASMPGTR